MSFTGDMIQGAFELLSGDTQAICRDAQGYSVSSWRATQITKGVATGTLAGLIPVAGYLTLPADLAYVMRLIHRSATGICTIKLGHADDDTFASVLGVWSGSIELNDELANQIGAKVLAKAATYIGGMEGVKLSIKALAMASQAIVHNKLAPKVAAKVATKVAAKMGAKTLTRWVPVVSAVVGGGTNLWILNGVSNAAEQYGDFILRHGAK